MSLDLYLDRFHDSGERAAFAVVETVDSTNRLAAAVARSYLADDRRPPPLIVLARGQSAGRGRLGRSWISPRGRGIYTSLLLSLADGSALAMLPLRVPVALCRALDAVLASPCGIKWPNDLMVGARKLGGVLIEGLGGPRAVVVGYGLNGDQRESELPTPSATSIRLAAAEMPDLERLAVDLAVSVSADLAATEAPEETVAAYRRRSVHRPGDPLSCRLSAEEEVTGRFAGFDELGRLRLETAEGERVLSAADIVAADAEAGAGAAAGPENR